MNAKILIADDESDIVSMLGNFFESKGFRVLPAFNGAEALKQVEKQPDIILLDINMPGTDGLEVCKRIRDHISCPILFLTARIEDTDKVKGFAVGGDDYIVKPFDSKELIARVKSVLRRSETRHSNVSKKVILPNLVINQTTYTVIYHGKELELPPKEFELLSFLAKYPNQVFKREELLDKIWGYEFVGDTRTVDVHIKRLREKMQYEDSWSIKTVWGVGYKFEVKNN